MTDAPELTEQDAGLHSILLAPEDDRPRLEYADWLDEHVETVTCSCSGTPWLVVDGRCQGCLRLRQKSNGFAERAEFIRVQCGLEPKDKKLSCNEGQVPSRCWWHHPLPHGKAIQWHFRRGFVERVECDTATFLGGPCRACDGDGHARFVTPDGLEMRNAEPGTCWDCDGTGGLIGIAAALFGSQPVTSVTLTDVEFRRHEFWRWCWVAGRINLPVDPKKNLGHWSREDAASALSFELVNYGRSVAAGQWHEVECEDCGGTKKMKGVDLLCFGCGGNGYVRKPGLPPLRRE